MSPISGSPEIYVATDVEADGPIPGPYSMLSLGMAAAAYQELAFYTQMQPISGEFVPQALSVSGVDRDRLTASAPTPHAAMVAAYDRVNGLREIGRPVFLAGPAVWDEMFVHWYFMRFVGKSPCGPTGSGVI